MIKVTILLYNNSVEDSKEAEIYLKEFSYYDEYLIQTKTISEFANMKKINKIYEISKNT